jgi:hypothetical protein
MLGSTGTPAFAAVRPVRASVRHPAVLLVQPSPFVRARGALRLLDACWHWISNRARAQVSRVACRGAGYGGADGTRVMAGRSNERAQDARPGPSFDAACARTRVQSERAVGAFPRRTMERSSVARWARTVAGNGDPNAADRRGTTGQRGRRVQGERRQSPSEGTPDPGR